MKLAIPLAAIALLAAPCGAVAQVFGPGYVWADEAELALETCMAFVNDPAYPLEAVDDDLAEMADYDELVFRSIQREDNPAPPTPYLRTSVLWDGDVEGGGGSSGVMVLKDENAGTPDKHSVLCIFGAPDQSRAEFDTRLAAVLEATAEAFPAGGAWVSVPPGRSMSATWRRSGVHVVDGISHPIEIVVDRFASINQVRARRVQPTGMPR